MDHNFYNKKKEVDSLEQGDIFNCLPFFNIDSNLIKTIDSADGKLFYKKLDIKNYEASLDGVLRNAVIDIHFKPAILITQNCDVLRSSYISFCEIRKFKDVDGSLDSITSEKRIVEFLTKKYAHQEKYFYLPAEDGVFDDRMAVDFSRIYQIDRTLLEGMKNKRICSLNLVPLEHFRVKIANYFKRFAYNGWYLLNKAEFNVFKTDKEKECGAGELKLINPYPWQE
ncbi:MAG: hypothetical protein ACD_7C00114G0005 [uncultured bacterium]|nr:MAG: hypothetical protein ACD_7C00114G0005 [uncultured bacterium]